MKWSRPKDPRSADQHTCFSRGLVCLPTPLSTQKPPAADFQTSPWSLQLYPGSGHTSQTSSLGVFWKVFSDEQEFQVSIFKNFSPVNLEIASDKVSDAYFVKNQATHFCSEGAEQRVKS